MTPIQKLINELEKLACKTENADEAEGYQQSAEMAMGYLTEEAGVIVKAHVEGQKTTNIQCQDKVQMEKAEKYYDEKYDNKCGGYGYFLSSEEFLDNCLKTSNNNYM
jgi:NAD-dependent SIR2 family protein deacetylase